MFLRQSPFLSGYSRPEILGQELRLRKGKVTYGDQLRAHLVYVSLGL